MSEGEEKKKEGLEMANKLSYTIAMTALVP